MPTTSAAPEATTTSAAPEATTTSAAPEATTTSAAPEAGATNDDLDFQVAEIINNQSASRYEAHNSAGELMGWMDYEKRKGNVISTTHTVTEPKFRGQGVAARLTRKIFADAAEAGKKIYPACWYVAEFVQKNPRYARQVADLSF